MFKAFDQRSIERSCLISSSEHIHDLGSSPIARETSSSGSQPATHLYVIVAGWVEVVDEDGNTITYLSSGEVFGEMVNQRQPGERHHQSRYSHHSVSSGTGQGFQPGPAQISGAAHLFARLLTQRLARSNRERSQDLSSGMSGKLSEMPPDELLQTLNITQKSG
ncbi:MAG: cyclic nucleotide-binding domain-containing protein [Desulfobacterales bacterium]